MRLVVVTGMSGGGKSTAMRALEDLGYYCADNLPIPLLPKFVELLAGREDIERAALVVDTRMGEFLQSTSATLTAIRGAGHAVEVLFFDAADDILIRRFSETRRRHPLSETDIRVGLLLERTALAPLRQEATAVIDTGGITSHTLRALIQERYGRPEGNLSVSLLSFGFKYGLPAEADMVLDVRFLPNPYFVEALSALSGENEAVQKYVMAAEAARTFVDKAEELLVIAIRGFEGEGKSYASVAVGCTGGRHRSVTIVNELGRRLGQTFKVSIKHRDIGKGGA